MALDLSIQDFINTSFDRTGDTAEALALLEQFQRIFTRDAVRVCTQH